MVSRLFKGAAVTVATLSFASAASAGCGSSLFCGQSGATSAIPAPLLTYESSASGSWSDSEANFGSASSWGSSSTYAPSSFSTTMSSTQADATYGTGSISDTYSGPSTFSFSGSTQGLPGLGHNESLQPVNCPVNVHGTGEGRVLGCYNVVKPVPQTTYYRVVRPVIYVRYPVPVAVPFTSPCHTIKNYSRYGDWGLGGFRGPRCR